MRCLAPSRERPAFPRAGEKSVHPIPPFVIPLRQEIGFFAGGERFFGMDGAEPRRFALLIARLGRVRNHQIGGAGGEGGENASVVGEDNDGRGVQMGAVEAFIGAAGVGDDADAGAVDRGQGRKTRGVGAAGEGGLAVFQDLRHSHILLVPIARV